MNDPTVAQYLIGAADLRQAAEEAARRGNLDRAAEDQVFGEAR